MNRTAEASARKRSHGIVPGSELVPVTREQMRAAKERLRHAIKERAVVSYSGGKDGLAVMILAREVSERLNVGVCEISLTFTEQKNDVLATSDRLGNNVHFLENFDLAWLQAHQQFLFPRDTKVMSRSYRVRQVCVERKVKQLGRRALITGRKRGANSVKAPVYDAHGFTFIHPLIDWTDANVWWYLEEQGMPRPWIYGTDYGWMEGSDMWPHLTYPDTDAEAWKIIRSIEPAIVRRAASLGLRGAA